MMKNGTAPVGWVWGGISGGAVAAYDQYFAIRQHHGIHIRPLKFISWMRLHDDPAIAPLNSITSAVALLRAVVVPDAPPPKTYRKNSRYRDKHKRMR